MPTTSDRTTQPREGDVATFLAAVENDRRRSDAEAVLDLMREVSGHEPRMWGPTMVGFGRRAVPDRRRQGARVVRHRAVPSQGRPDPLRADVRRLERRPPRDLGPHTTGKGCLYVKRLEDLDRGVLIDLVRRSWEANDERPC